MPTVDYKEIFEKAEVGIALNDPDTGTVGKVNERYAVLMGYSRDELQDMAIEEISADDPMMETLIDDLLTLARAGDTIGDITAVGLTELVESCWRNVETNSAELRIEAGSTVNADRRRLQQLLENLLANSVEHGGDDVTVTVDTLPNGFYVEDDGPGIPENEHENVFKAGYSTAEEGTGFGLSIVKETAEAHGWDISVTEGSNGGARFEITNVELAE